MNAHLKCRQPGQAMTEFCVLLTALSPLMLLIPMLGRHLDLIHTAEIASRYVAFESIAHDPLNGRLNDDRIAADVARRFFSRSDAMIRTIELPSDAPGERNGLWVDQRAQPLLPDLRNSISVTTRAATRDPFPGARHWWNDGFGLRSRNLITGTVAVRPVLLPPIARKTALLVDDWSALSTRDVQLRIENARESIYPSDEMDPVLRVVGQFPRLLTDEPMEPGLKDWEVVPCDRLESGCTP
jgi:hypothetical protein